MLVFWKILRTYWMSDPNLSSKICRNYLSYVLFCYLSIKISHRCAICKFVTKGLAHFRFRQTIFKDGTCNDAQVRFIYFNGRHNLILSLRTNCYSILLQLMCRKSNKSVRDHLFSISFILICTRTIFFFLENYGYVLNEWFLIGCVSNDIPN